MPKKKPTKKRTSARQRARANRPRQGATDNRQHDATSTATAPEWCINGDTAAFVQEHAQSSDPIMHRRPLRDYYALASRFHLFLFPTTFYEANGIDEANAKVFNDGQCRLVISTGCLLKPCHYHGKTLTDDQDTNIILSTLSESEKVIDYHSYDVPDTAELRTTTQAVTHHADMLNTISRKQCGEPLVKVVIARVDESEQAIVIPLPIILTLSNAKLQEISQELGRYVFFHDKFIAQTIKTFHRGISLFCKFASRCPPLDKTRMLEIYKSPKLAYQLIEQQNFAELFTVFYQQKEQLDSTQLIDLSYTSLRHLGINKKGHIDSIRYVQLITRYLQTIATAVLNNIKRDRLPEQQLSAKLNAIGKTFAEEEILPLLLCDEQCDDIIQRIDDEFFGAIVHLDNKIRVLSEANSKPLSADQITEKDKSHVHSKKQKINTLLSSAVEKLAQLRLVYSYMYENAQYFRNLSITANEQKTSTLMVFLGPDDIQQRYAELIAIVEKSRQFKLDVAEMLSVTDDIEQDIQNLNAFILHSQEKQKNKLPQFFAPHATATAATSSVANPTFADGFFGLNETKEVVNSQYFRVMINPSLNHEMAPKSLEEFKHAGRRGQGLKLINKGQLKDLTVKLELKGRLYDLPVTHELKDYHSEGRLIFACLACDGNSRSACLIGFEYLPSGLHTQADITQLKESLKHKVFNIEHPHAEVSCTRITASCTSSSGV